jgi:hypothetical protein
MHDDKGSSSSGDRHNWTDSSDDSSEERVQKANRPLHLPLLFLHGLGDTQYFYNVHLVEAYLLILQDAEYAICDILLQARC